MTAAQEPQACPDCGDSWGFADCDCEHPKCLCPISRQNPLDLPLDLPVRRQTAPDPVDLDTVEEAS